MELSENTGKPKLIIPNLSCLSRHDEESLITRELKLSLMISKPFGYVQHKPAKGFKMTSNKYFSDHPTSYIGLKIVAG